VSKRDNSSLILQNLKKRDLRPLGEPIVPFEEAERRLSPFGPGSESTRPVTAASGAAITRDSGIDSSHDSYHAGTHSVDQYASRGTRLKPRERVARSALIVRLDPALHRELEQVARFNRLTMNDIAIEAIELHLKNFAHPHEVDSHGDKG
jgi:hypothetical protein